MKLKILLALCALSIGGLRAQVIFTGSTWDGTTSVPFGSSSLTTVGEVFTAPAGATSLDAFGFAVESTLDTGITYAVAVTPWNLAGMHADGPVLFASAPVTSAPGGFSPALFSTGGVAVTAGQLYVAFLTVSPFLPTPSAGAVGFLGTDVYADGGAVGIVNGGDIGALFSSPWEAVPQDLVFVASFSSSPVPEPATYGLVGAATLLAAVAILRRKRESVSAAA